MAGRKTSVIQVMIAGDSRDLQKATKAGASAFGVLAGAAVAATKVITSAAGAIAGFSIREFAKFDDAMTRSTAIMGDMSDTMRTDMEQAARDVAKSTRFTAEQAADSFFFLASAGLDATQSLQALPQVAAFAQAGAFDMARATDLLTDAQSALGLTVDDTAENMANMARVSDVLIGANTLANATAEEFSEALTNKAGAALRVLGKDVEEGAAVLAFFADQGVKGATAGEALNIVLRDVTRAAGRNRDEFDKLGLNVLDSEGNLRNMADVVDEFTDLLGPMSDAQQAVTLDQLGLTRSVGNNIRQLLGGGDAIREYEDALRNMGGVTDEVADKQLESFSAQLDILQSGFADLGITIGEELAGPLGRFVEWFQDQLPAIETFVEESIPKVESFVDRAVTKFQEFKDFYDENLAEPLGDLLENLRELGGLTLDKVFEFKDAASDFLVDFANAVADEDSEEAGRILGQTITELLDLAISTAGDLTDAIGEWFGRQDWEAIGASVAKHAGAFGKGLFSGLFTTIDEETGERQFDWSNFMKLLAAGLVLRIPVFRNALRARSGLFSLPIVGTILTALGNVIILLTPGLGRLGSRIARVLSASIGRALSGTVVGRIFSNIGLTIQRLFAGQFSSLPARLAGSIRGLFSGLGTLLLNGAKGLWGFLTRGFNFAILRATVWLQTGGLGLFLRGFGAMLAGIVAAVGGWPLAIFAAVVAAFTLFIWRFGRWNEENGHRYESFGEKIVAFIMSGIIRMSAWFIQNVVSWFLRQIARLTEFWATQYGRFKGWGADMIEGIKEGIADKAGSLASSLISAARNAWESTKNFLGISSPSKLFEAIGRDMMEGLSNGIDESAGIIQASVGVNSQMAANEARRFAEMAAAQRAEREAARTVTTPAPNLNVTVTSADPEKVVEALRRYTRRNGPLGGYVRLGAGEFV